MITWFHVVEIPHTTRDLCSLLKNSIISLLQANKDTTIDASKIKIFPEDSRNVVDDSDDSDVDIFAFSLSCKHDVEQTQSSYIFRFDQTLKSFHSHLAVQVLPFVSHSPQLRAVSSPAPLYQQTGLPDHSSLPTIYLQNHSYLQLDQEITVYH